MCLLERMENSDVLIVTKLERLGLNAMGIGKTVEMLTASGIRGVAVDITRPAGEMIIQVIYAVAEFERDLLLERTHAGIERTKASGKHFCRPPALNDELGEVNMNNKYKTRETLFINIFSLAKLMLKYDKYQGDGHRS